MLWIANHCLVLHPSVRLTGDAMITPSNQTHRQHALISDPGTQAAYCRGRITVAIRSGISDG